MKIYKVGGAVRDELLGKVVKDIDWVVVGATPDQLLSKGYLQVGKDFPVFLHPDTKEEYALARTERKSGHGYAGFEVLATPNVTLEDDLLRRDLTINAIAMDGEGKIIDPYHGRQDLENKRLRHVSAAFEDDPLRVLRLARFYARFYDEGFQIAEETKTMVHRMVASGELSHLVPERIWLETQKALSENNPSQYFLILEELGALSVIFPQIAQCFKDRRHNADKSFAYVTKASQKRLSMHLRVALLLSMFENGHDVQVFSQQYRLSSHEKVTAEKLVQWRSAFENLSEASTWLQLIVGLDAFRKRDQLIDFLCCMEIIQTMNEGVDAYCQRSILLLNIYEKLVSIEVQSLIAGLSPKEIPKRIEAERLALINKMLKS